MNTHLLALYLMAAQGCLGAFDTLFHHELTEALPRQDSAGRELAIHAARATIYSVLFIGISAWEWHGALAIVLFAIFAVEIVLTLWDFVVEDRTRLLPATERVTHTVLAINGGAFITLLAMSFPEWLAQPSGFAWHDEGFLSLFLALCGAGVGISGIRDAFASRKVVQRLRAAAFLPPVSFGPAQSILVSGGTGFIGTQLVRALLDDGHQITILSRRPRQASWRFNGMARSLSSLAQLHPDTRIDTVVNLAGAPILGWRWTPRRRAELLRSRVETTQALVKWIEGAKTKPRLLLSASAIGYYGIQPLDGDTLLTESSPAQPIFMSELCQRWEEAAQKASTCGVRIVCMRLGVVFGRKGALPMMLLPIRLGLGGRLGSGRQWISWVHIRDVVRGIAHLVRSDASEGIYNLTAPGSVTQSDFSRIAGQAFRRPSLFPTPAMPMRALLGEQSELLLQGQRVAPERLTEEGFLFDYPDLALALRNLA